MKKIISLLLAMLLVFSLTTAAFADTNAQATNGTITVNGASEDTYYTIYRLLDLVTYDKAGGAYTYQLNAEWTGFFNEAKTKEYVKITPNQNHQYSEFTWIAADNDATFAEFAKYALSYAIEKGITPVNTTKTNVTSRNEGKVNFNTELSAMVFSDLPLGWYLVDSTAGALCGLTTTDPNAAVNAKNVPPSIEKQVEEDLTKIFGSSNTADIGQDVNFMSIVHVQKGLENYVIHDKMTEAFIFEHTTANKGVTDVHRVRSGAADLPLTEDEDYTIELNQAGCTFEIVFTPTGMSKLEPNDRIIVYYHAMLSRYAEAGSNSDNINETWLTYGEGKTTSKAWTETFTYAIDIVKTDSSNNLIQGAKFRIYDAQNGGNEIKVVELKDHDEKHILDAQGQIQYRLAREDEPGVEIECKTGRVTVIGFDNGTYYLEETQEPKGYNKLTTRQRFDIIDQNLTAAFPDGIYSSGSGVQVVNRTGSMLPETGAMGTSMFILFGMFVMLGTGVLLVTKKRMSMIED